MSELKAFAIAYVGEHDNLSLSEKQLICNFIVEGNDDQINYLLSTGKMKNNLTEDDKSLIEGGWSAFMNTKINKDPIKSIYKAGQSSGMQTGIVASVIVAGAVVAGAKAYQRFLTKAAKSCKGKSGTEKTSCMQQFKLQAIKAKVGELQKGLSACSKSKDPTSCKAKMQVKIAKEKAKLGR